MTLRNRIAPETRRSMLKALLEANNFVRCIEVHNGISALIANDTAIEAADKRLEFDALWISSFTDSAAKGYPDIEVVSYDSRIDTINQVLDVTTKPVIVDGDTGGDVNHFEYLVKRLERLGVSAVVIEDKIFPKRNSLDASARQDLEDPEAFAIKIKRGKQMLMTGHFMIIARLESLIAGYGIKDALKRAELYLKAGADGIMIHTKDNNPAAVIQFAGEYNKICRQLGFRKPLVAVPTTYNMIRDDELRDNGFNIVIHANHMLRASYKAMEAVSKAILIHNRSFEADPSCATVSQIFDAVGFSDVKIKDREEMERLKSNIRAIIPAAGSHSALGELVADRPCCMIDINGRTILQRQIDALNKLKIRDVVVVRGYKKECVNLSNIKYYDNDTYEDGFILKSLFMAEPDFENGFIYINSDILFNEDIIQKLLTTRHDIVLVVDNSYSYHQHDVDKKLDMVVTKHRDDSYRKLNLWSENTVLRIGKLIDKDLAHYEFVGIAYFSKYGAEVLSKVYHDCLKYHAGKFHEADFFRKSSFTDIIQEVIDRGFNVNILEVHKGWMELHNQKDYKAAIEQLP